MVIVGMILCSLFLVAVWRVDFDEKAKAREAEVVSVPESAPQTARS
jgi:hypothetical protein